MLSTPSLVPLGNADERHTNIVQRLLHALLERRGTSRLPEGDEIAFEQPAQAAQFPEHDLVRQGENWATVEDLPPQILGLRQSGQAGLCRHPLLFLR